MRFIISDVGQCIILENISHICVHSNLITMILFDAYEHFIPVKRPNTPAATTSEA